MESLSSPVEYELNGEFGRGYAHQAWHGHTPGSQWKTPCEANHHLRVCFLLLGVSNLLGLHSRPRLETRPGDELRPPLPSGLRMGSGHR